MGAYPRSPQEVPVKKVLIMGAAGRDFHNFNVAYRDDPEVEVVAFTATQIPGIEGRRYPPELAGTRYPDGIPIHPEEDLSRLIGELEVDEVVFSYSDVAHEYVMHRGSEVLAAGAPYTLLGPKATMLVADKPVVAICAVRTGAGKSQTTRAVIRALKGQGRNPVAVRHPMPYGNLVAQRVQRFATYEDLEEANATVEEREEYEAHLANDTVVYAGVDYEEILKKAQSEADVVVWDGGNNDLPFYRPDVHFVVADPHRPGHETSYHQEVYQRYPVGPVLPAMGYSAEQIDEMERTIDATPADVVVIATPVGLAKVADIRKPTVRV